MNIQMLKINMTKGQRDLTKDVVVVVDNKEYDIAVVTQNPDKVVLTTVEKVEEEELAANEVEARAYAGNDPVIEEAEEELAEEETEENED